MSSIWNTDTLLDISVNFVPIVVMVAFLLLFLFAAYWGMSLALVPLLQIGGVLSMIVILGILTYVAAKKIED